MSSRTLSAYFDDYRRGKKEFALLREFLLQTFSRAPLRRGHLLHWLDQAQYEHPIPVTDFLLLRKEVEMILKSEPEAATGADATLIADGLPPLTPEPLPCNADATRIAHPDSAAGNATLVADAGATILAPGRATGTDVTRLAPRPASSGDYTPIPERSDHAGLHDAATSFNPARPHTLTPSAAPLPMPAQPRSRLPLVMGGSVLGLLLVLGGIIAFQYLPQRATDAAGTADFSTTRDVNQLLREAPTGSIGATQSGTDTATRRDAESGQASLDSIPGDAGEDSPPRPDLGTLDAPALLTLIRDRVAMGTLLPADDPATAHGALRELERRFAGREELITARKLLKDTHLKLSDQARAEGRWEAAQQHLDAAFDVLQPHSLSATAPSTGS